MKILGIESSCDETAAAVVEDGKKILSNEVVSQIDIFKEYGGVIPEVAARSHLEAVLPVIDKALSDAEANWDDIDAIAVTHTPGLLGSLLIGTLTARTEAILHNKKLYPVHHLKSHIYANWLESVEEPEFPLIAVVVSGGHTQILYMPAHNKFEIIGTTLDDAVGECFDKVAKILGLNYPGGPEISRLAKMGNRDRYKLPEPNIPDLDFSFSGLKTAVLRAVQKEVGVDLNFPSYELKNRLTEQQKADFAGSFEKIAVEIIIHKVNKALKMYPEVKSVVFAGGVSANEYLREKTGELEGKIYHGVNNFDKNKNFGGKNMNNMGVKVYFPERKYSGDNGAMVASSAYYEILTVVKECDPYKLDILPRSRIE